MKTRDCLLRAGPMIIGSQRLADFFYPFIVVNRNKGDGEGQTQFTADLPKTFFSGEHFSGKFSQFFSCLFVLYLHRACMDWDTYV